MAIVEFYAVMYLLTHSSSMAQLASKPEKPQTRADQLKSGTEVLQDVARPWYVPGFRNCHPDPDWYLFQECSLVLSPQKDS